MPPVFLWMVLLCQWTPITEPVKMAPEKSSHKMLPFLLYTPLLLAIPVCTAPVYQWEFQVRETQTKDTHTTVQNIGTACCPPKGCQEPVVINISPKTISSTYWPYACFPFDNKDRSRCLTDVPTYGGWRYWSCILHDALSPKTKAGKPSIIRLQGSQFTIQISDPWDTRWQEGVTGKLYNDGYTSYPKGTIYISRQLTLAERREQINQVIIETEKKSPFGFSN